MQLTLSIIKPDAVKNNLIGQINAKLEARGLKIVAQKMLQLSYEKAAEFYAIHASRPFFKSLCEFMSSGPIVAQVLAHDDAVMLNRQVMGATNPSEAAAGTIRKEHAASIDENCVHGSDSEENAHVEIKFFFTESEIFPRH